MSQELTDIINILFIFIDESITFAGCGEAAAGASVVSDGLLSLSGDGEC